MATFQTVGEIERAINKGLSALAQSADFQTALKSCLHQSIYKNVYSFPEGQYKRRYDNGGLGDKNNMVTSKDKRSAPAVAQESFDVFFPELAGQSYSWGEGDDPLMEASNSSGAGSSASVTISITDNAPTERPSPYALDDMVESGGGRGNMAYKRLFYQPAGDLVENYSDTFEIIIESVLNNYL